MFVKLSIGNVVGTAAELRELKNRLDMAAISCFSTGRMDEGFEIEGDILKILLLLDKLSD